MGVWIETGVTRPPLFEKSVTSFVGVWIETVDASVSLQKSQVTSFVGVWIETYRRCDTCQDTGSHPSWVCGLKLLMPMISSAAP